MAAIAIGRGVVAGLQAGPGIGVISGRPILVNRIMTGHTGRSTDIKHIGGSGIHTHTNITFSDANIISIGGMYGDHIGSCIVRCFPYYGITGSFVERSGIGKPVQGQITDTGFLTGLSR